jgi:hypothetical protein
MNGKEPLHPAGEEDIPTVRIPETFGEKLLANFKPQPALPALIVLIISILVPAMSYDPNVINGDSGSIFLLLIPFGIVVSCGLAVAAGFCSLFPQLAWIALATWALKFTQGGPLPAYNRWVLLVGIVAAAAMVVMQIWRVKTGKFQPTIRVRLDEEC